MKNFNFKLAMMLVASVLFGINFIQAQTELSGTGVANGCSANTNGNTNNTSVGCNSGNVNMTGDYNTFIGKSAGTSAGTGANNTFVGYYAGYGNGSGAVNVCIGSNAGYTNSSGLKNTFTGCKAGYLTNANYNTFNGYVAGYNNSSGTQNTFIGLEAGYSNTSSSYSTIVGSDAGYYNTGGANTFMGQQAGFYNTSGYNNTFLGYHTGGTNTTGNNITLLGYGANVGSAGLSNATAIGNNAIVNASNSLVLGNGVNVGIGTSSPGSALDVKGTIRLSGSTSGYVGLTPAAAAGSTTYTLPSSDGTSNQVLQTNGSGILSWATPTTSATAWQITGNSGTTSGTNFMGTTDDIDVVFKRNNVQSGLLNNSKYNTAWGVGALRSNTDGKSNTAIGYKSLYSNTTGLWNTAVGDSSLILNSTGEKNTAVGYYALKSNTSSYQNTAVGYCALENNTSGLNSAFGAYALKNNTLGWENTGIGLNALTCNISGSYNTAIGRDALANSRLNGNTALGYYTGYNLNDISYSTFIGTYADASQGVTGAMAIGYNARTNANNKIVIGTSSNTNLTGGYGSWQDFSDGRFKDNIEENVPGLSFINKLRPVTYTLNAEKVDSFLGIKQRMDTIHDETSKDRYYQRLNEVSNVRQTGFIAQEVDSIAHLVGYDFDGVQKPSNDKDNFTIGYATFVVPLVKAIQELSKSNDSLKTNQKILDSLIAAQNATINSLLAHQAATDNMLTTLQNCCSQGALQKTFQNDNSQDKSETTLHVELANNSQPILYQNEPNPFGVNTVIRYFVPENISGTAYIVFYNMYGKEIKRAEITDRGYGKIDAQAGKLATGIYSYSMVIDDKIIDTKRMIKSN